MFSAESLQSLLPKARRFVVAYSGGLDSHVLLHAMVQCAPRLRLASDHIDLQSDKINLIRSQALARSVEHPSPFRLQVVHVNHQLNPASNQWAEHCMRVCDALKIPCVIETIDLSLQPGDSIEEIAREKRYHALEKYMNEETVLLTAHTQNDQAETFLLQALRGASPKGLSAMPEIKKLQRGKLFRPLLKTTRDELHAYAIKHELQWIEDDSNTNTRFNRNYLRHEIFPLLKKRWPTVYENLARAAKHAASHDAIVNDVTQQDMQHVVMHEPDKINLKTLRAFSPEKQKLLLREWLRRNAVRMPSEKQLHHIQRDVVWAGNDADPLFQLENSMIKRTRDYLYLVTT